MVAETEHKYKTLLREHDLLKDEYQASQVCCLCVGGGGWPTLP